VEWNEKTLLIHLMSFPFYGFLKQAVHHYAAWQLVLVLCFSVNAKIRTHESCQLVMNGLAMGKLV